MFVLPITPTSIQLLPKITVKISASDGLVSFFAFFFLLILKKLELAIIIDPLCVCAGLSLQCRGRMRRSR
uniref:Uncharacterized protein n=1 Tax=Oryza brachyantha TaxID=4533 RepID=J3M9Y8_ORYBR